MTKEEIFEYFYTNSANLGVKSILLVMLAGIIINTIIYMTYKLTYKGVSYNKKFNESLVIINLISIVIMLMISSNIVISLGMVGALSIVRFRTAIKDSRDTVYIFWAITEGLSIGSQNFKLALLTSLIIAIVLIALEYIPKYGLKYLIIIRGKENPINMENVFKNINNYVETSTIRTANKSSENQEYIIEVRTKKELNLKVIDSVMKVKGVTSVNYISENGENVG